MTTVYIVCEYGHEDSGTIQRIKAVYSDEAAATKEHERVGVYGHFVLECAVSGGGAKEAVEA